MIKTENGKTYYINNKELLIAIKESHEQNKMTPKLAKLFQLLCLKYASSGNFANYCVDDRTEALTKQGWKNDQTITEQDEILSYDIDTKTLVWSEIFEIFRNHEYDGMMPLESAKGD